MRGVAWASGGWLPADTRGTTYSGIVAVWDWYATFCDIAGVDATDHRAAAAGLPPIDSVSFLKVLLGQQQLAEASGELRQTLALGSEPTDGFANGSTVAGWIQVINSSVALCARSPD